METFTTLTRALSDESRVRAVLALKGRELCVCQIIELLGLAPSTVSKHMSILKQAGLVTMRKEGRWAFYRLPYNPSPMVRQGLDWVFTTVESSSQARADRNALKKILKIDKETLCTSQGSR